MTELGKIAYNEYAAAERRFMRSSQMWENLAPTVQASWEAAAKGVIDHIACAPHERYDEPFGGEPASPPSDERTYGEIYWDSYRGATRTAGWAVPHGPFSSLSEPHRAAVQAAAETVAADVMRRWTPELAPQAEPKPARRYALVEQMGHRSTTGTVTETTFCGRPMLAVTNLVTGRDHLISPDSLYEITWLTEDEARKRAQPWVPAALTATAEDDDEDESARELAEEGNAVAMSDAERAEYDRDGEAWLDAQDEADDEQDGDD